MKPSVVAFLVVFLLLLALVVILVPTLYYTLYYKGYATPQCPLANETRGYDDRVDCAPEGDVSEATCVERGCCWHPVNVTGIDARPPPECFFPSNYGYYMVGEPEQTEKGWTATIERLHTPPMFGDETTKLKVEVEMQTKSRLRIKLTDAENHRYEAPLPMVPVEEDFDALDVNSTSEAAYNVTFQSTPFSLKVTRKETGTVIFDTSAGALVFSDYFLQLTTSLPSENVYGVGEHVRGRYRHAAAWKTWTLFSQTSQHAREGANLAGVHPVYMCIEEGGYTHGVFLHNSNAMDVVLQPLPSITYRTIGGIFDFYIYLGPTPESVYEQHSTAVGRPFMVPYWALGFQLGREGYPSIGAVYSVVQRMRNTNIPYDVQHLDLASTHNHSTLTLDEDSMKGLPEFLSDLHRHGQRGALVLTPGVETDDLTVGSPFSRGQARDVFIKTADGEQPGRVVYPDFGKDSTVDWWYSECSALHGRLGYDALVLSKNEPLGDPTAPPCDPDSKLNHPPYLPKIGGAALSEDTLCMDSVQHWGDIEHPHYDLHNLYGTSMAAATARANDWIFGDKQGLLTSRSTYPGAGKYAGTLLADNHSNWPDMQRSIPAMLEFGLFGIPYVGASICGFHGNAGEELCQRWMQLGAFYPLCWNHNAQDQTPQDPSYFSGDMQQASLTAMHVRYSLLPYLYTLFHHAHVRGHSVARPLLNEFSNDPNTYDIDRQFMWGPGLLISPALDQGSTNVRAYFPPGLWYDYYTATKVRQGLRTLKTPLDRVNIHFRGGYIVPGQVPGNTTQFSRKNVMRLFVALDHAERASGELYWDDGETKDAYEKGEYLSVKFTCSSEQLRWTAEHNSLRGERLHVGFIDILGMPHYPRRILIDGATVLKPGQYEWQSSTNFLRLKRVRLPISKTTVIQWTY